MIFFFFFFLPNQMVIDASDLVMPFKVESQPFGKESRPKRGPSNEQTVRSTHGNFYVKKPEEKNRILGSRPVSRHGQSLSDPTG
jgi:hypothetical protein